MATANPTPPDHGEDNFVLELERVREQIKQKFIELVDCVKARECKLLKELDTILASYQSYRDEVEKQEEKKRDLMIVQESLTQNLTKIRTQSIKSYQENYLKQIGSELQLISLPQEPKIVHFVFDNSRINAKLNKLGELVEKIRNVDYKSKTHPVVSVCETGNEMEQLYSPWGVTVDEKTGNIYVADQWNHCVKVFDDSGKVIFKFGDSDGEGKMLFPRGLTVSGDKILISNGESLTKFNHYILIYQMNGEFLSKIGKYGQGETEFKYPCGLACNELNGDIYICDSNNNRIQILSKELQFKSQFGANSLKQPVDVKLSKEFIYILDTSNPCIHLYDYNLILQKSVISRRERVQVGNPSCFFIDDSNFILISMYYSNSIHIFNPDFELIHKITTHHPMGVVVDKKGSVIVVCQADRDCLQFF